MKGNINTHHIRSGFTLIELLVVISVIGMLSSVVLASLQSARAKGSIGAGQTFDRHTYGAYYDDLVLAWDFDNDSGNTVKDQSGNGNDLTYSGGTGTGPSTEQNPFRTGKSFKMNGGTAATTVTIKKPPNGDYTVSFWLYPTVLETTEFVSAFDSTDSVSNDTFIFNYTAGGSNGFAFTVRSTGWKYAALGQLQVNTWHHIALVCGSGKISIYVNGRITGTSANLIPPACKGFVDDNLKIAFDPGLSADTGKLFYLDNVRIYSRALPISAIDSLYFADLFQSSSLAKNSKGK